MAGGRHRAAGEPPDVDLATSSSAAPVAAMPPRRSSSSEPVRPDGPAIYDPTVLPRPAAGPRHGGGRRAAGLRAPAALRSARLTLSDPRHRALAVGITVVVATVGGTGLVLTSAAAPAPRHAAAGPVHTAAPARTSTSAAPTTPAALASSSAVALPPAPVAGPAAPTRAASTAPVQAAAVSALTSDGIPSTALAAYRNAAARELHRAPACGITWPLLAGIGRVESDHGRFGGAVLHTDGSATPRILGVPLDGHGTAVIRDTDHGRLDGDTVYDRAVGPMQFIPSTWAGWGVDANHDGVARPEQHLRRRRRGRRLPVRRRPRPAHLRRASCGRSAATTTPTPTSPWCSRRHAPTPAGRRWSCPRRRRAPRRPPASPPCRRPTRARRRACSPSPSPSRRRLRPRARHGPPRSPSPDADPLEQLRPTPAARRAAAARPAPRPGV